MKLLILHLSDIHIREEANACLDRLDKVAPAIANEVSDVATAVIVVSGDIAFSGSKEEYAIALPKLQAVKAELARRLRDVPIHCLAVPGNHDCDFRETGSIRAILIEKLNDDPSVPFANDACDACTAVQKEFFDFLTQFQTAIPSKTKRHVYFEYSIPVGSAKALFRCFNTAMTSRNPEKPMELVYPVEALKEAGQYAPHDFVVSVFHHPSSWISQGVQKSFAHHVESLSDLMLTGHEHEADSFSLSRARGDNVTFVEGAAFQEHRESQYSGFNAVWVDLASQTRKAVTYAWVEDHFEPETSHNPWLQFKRGGLVAKRDFVLTDEYDKFLDDPGANYAHPSGQPLTVHNLFVYPDAHELQFDGKREDIGDKHIPSRDLLKFILNKRRLVFLGQERIGKSTLARVLFREFYERNLVPVLISGEDITSTKVEKFIELIQQRFLRHYQNPKLPLFEQLDRDQTVVLIDDFDHSKLPRKARLALLEQIHKRFERVCIFTDESIRFEELREAQFGKIFLTEYAQLQLLEFGMLLRTRIITKWVEVGSQFDLTTEELHRRITQYEFQIDHLLKQGYLPSLPFFVLTLLQALSNSELGSAPSASYAKLQEILITKALAIENRVADVIAKETYLAELAYALFCAKERSLSEKAYEVFHQKYNAQHDTRLNLKDLREELKKASILTTFDGETSFKYSYHFYYFVAHYFWKNLHLTAVKEEVEKLSTRIHREETANIWMFLTYLCPDPWLRDLLLKHAKSMFADITPIRLESDVSFLSSVYDSIPKIIHRDDTPESIRERRRLQADEQARVKQREPTDEECEQDEVLRSVADLNDALRTIQVLGQVVKTFAGQLEAEPKRVLIQECYNLGLRVLSVLLGAWKDNPEQIIENIIDNILKRFADDQDIKNMTRDDLTKLVKGFIFMFSEMITFNVIKRISQAVGSPHLELSYDRLVEASESPSYAVRLLDSSVRLDIKKIDVKAVVKVHKGIEDSVFADRVLKHLVIHYFRLFHTEVATRQALCEALDIPVEFGRQQALLNPERKRI
jgi:GTPase SAR1 family protein